MMKLDDVVKDIAAMLEGAEAPASEECCIYRVPFDIRKLNEDAYTPKVVSIGPFHHNTHPRLHNMERYKLIYCKAFLQRIETSLDTWIRYIQEEEPNFRRCYSDTLQFTKEQLVKIIFVDSGFIFELFWRAYYDDWSENDMFVLKPWLDTNIRLDLLLLENQLPFSVLQALFNKSFISRSGVRNNKIPSFLKLTVDYFSYYNRSKLSFDDDISIRHFTDLIRIFHLQQTQQRRHHDVVKHLPSATELLEAGVKFKGNAENKCLLDLRFSGRVLEIPQLKVEDWTELLFRNMVALEQCHYPHHSYITDYVAVFDFLVNTSRDVDILVRKGVLVNWLGDTDSVANMFNGLWKNISHLNFSSSYFDLCQDLNAFCRNPWHKLKSTLRRDYCSSPWQTAASIAGILLLILSLLQSKHDDVVNAIKAMLEGAETLVSEECCIYRVPSDIRRLNEEEYTPKVVSIGPFHHNRHPRLHNMERHKLIYCKAFLERTQTSLDSWICYIEGVESNFRRCYSDTLDEFSHEELVKMIFVDSGFIFELFWRCYRKERSGNDGFLLKPWLATNIRLDLLLLENQLPFFVLDTLFNISFPSTSAHGNNNIPSFIQLTFDYFQHYNISYLSFQNISIRHFTDLIRTFHLQHPSQRRAPRMDESKIHLPSASELLEAGVKFKENTKSNCLLDLRFSGGVLEIPQLKVADSTELLFRNMVALEQCHYPHDSYITDYVAVFDFLVNTSRDVDILVRKRVLVNWLGDADSVANMFNGLWKNITYLNFSSHYIILCEDLNAFCRDPLHKLNSTLRRDYCNTPWQTAVSVAGILLLFLSLVDTITRMMNDDGVVIDIEAMLEGADPPVSDECCIYKVPLGIRRHNEDAYTPMVVSIGPFHHNRHPRLLNMEKLKLSYCKAFLERTQTTSSSWINYIQEVEPHLHRYYSDTLEFSKMELVKMIFVDSGFIFELFWRCYYEEWSGNDGFVLKPWLDYVIRLDLLLLENQLPFLILHRLFDLSFNSRSAIPSFLELTFEYFAYYNRSNLNSDNISIRHFTDLIRTFHLQHPQQSERHPDLVMHLPSATELSEAGVRLKGNTKSNCCLLDLKFSGRVLEIPQLVVEDGTEVLFRNIVALEQCHYPHYSYITDYVDFLDFLVNTSKDVDILVRKRVLVNWLGDTDSVAKLFNGLMKNITQSNSNCHYYYLCQHLNAFCRDPWHKLNFTLRRDYCNSPWKTAASIAGILLLILSLLQSVCSVLQVL
ncbi:UPF0481 protein, partial [Mucuna pruriens]